MKNFTNNHKQRRNLKSKEIKTLTKKIGTTY